MTKKKLVWSLKVLPTPTEVRGLVEANIISKEEAKEILFDEKDVVKEDIDALKQEIKFLKSLVEKLSESKTQIIESIRYVEKPYNNYPWWGSYNTWCASVENNKVLCSSDNASANYNCQDVNASYNLGGMGMSAISKVEASGEGFSNIKTF